MRVRHRVAGASPREHRQIVGHVAEGDHVFAVDAALRSKVRQRGAFGDAEWAHLDESTSVRMGRLDQVANQSARDDQQLVGRHLGMRSQQLGGRVRGHHVEIVHRQHDIAADVPAAPVRARSVDVEAVLQSKSEVWKGGRKGFDDLDHALDRDQRRLENPLGMQVVDDGPIRADHDSVVICLLRDRGDPARWATGD